VSNGIATTPSDNRPSARQGLRLVAVTALAGAGAGVIIALLGALVSRVGPSGNGWSFKGNGALIVAFGVGPALLAGGWTLLVLHARRHRRWLALGIGAGLVGLVMPALSIIPLVALGSDAGAAASGIAQLLELAWVLGAPVLAAVLPLSVHRELRGWHVVAGIALPIALVLGQALASFFVRG
jgi:hypothetical protein